MMRLCQWAISKIPKDVDEEMSPFPLSTAYYTAAAYLNLYYRDNNPEYLERLSELKTLLTLCNERWKVGGKSYSLQTLPNSGTRIFNASLRSIFEDD